MRRLITALLLIATVGGLFAIAGYFLFLRIRGVNFVHETSFQPNQIPPAYTNKDEESDQDTIAFAVIDDKFKFDKQLNNFLSTHPQYQLPDKLKILEYAGCGRDDMSIRKQIYFDQEPKEIYRITFDENSNIGFVDLVYSLKDSSWHCSNKNKLDVQTKQRILKRLHSEILENLP